MRSFLVCADSKEFTLVCETEELIRFMHSLVDFVKSQVTPLPATQSPSSASTRYSSGMAVTLWTCGRIWDALIARAVWWKAEDLVWLYSRDVDLR